MADLKDKLKKIVDKVRRGKDVKLTAEPAKTTAKAVPKDVREAVEAITGGDLRKVRIHTGGNVKEIAKELGAKAFVQGPDLYIAENSDANSKEFLAHELAHVLQQGNGTTPSTPRKGRASISR